MKIHLITYLTLSFLILTPLYSQRSLLNNDPEVVYLEEVFNETIELTIAKKTAAYSNKNGGKRLAVFAQGTKVQLLAIGEKSYQVKGQAIHTGVRGWVDPELLSSEDPDFMKNLSSLYERQLAVQELIDNKEIAIGMTMDEVILSRGEPNETEIKQTRDGESGQWAYVETEIKKHYNTVFNRSTGQTFRKFSHSTVIEKSRVTIEFENNLITAITEKKNTGRHRAKIISNPIIFHR